jgi:hypothetical protein
MYDKQYPMADDDMNDKAKANSNTQMETAMKPKSLVS